MNAQPLFRELIYIDHLKRGGIEEAHARVMAEALNIALSEAVATKQDIAEVKADIERLEARTVAGITQVRTELKAEIAEVRTELKAEIAQVRVDVEKVRTDIAERMRQQTIWLAATIVGAAGLAITIAKLFLVTVHP